MVLFEAPRMACWGCKVDMLDAGAQPVMLTRC
jgi:hypothetical protein